jgi:hypothetical protein
MIRFTDKNSNCYEFELMSTYTLGWPNQDEIPTVIRICLCSDGWSPSTFLDIRKEGVVWSDMSWISDDAKHYIERCLANSAFL